MKYAIELWTNEKGKRFVVLPEDDFLRLSEQFEDRGLSRILKEAIASDTGNPSIPFSQVKRALRARRRIGREKPKR